MSRQKAVYNSGNNEWYTPAPYVDAAFDVMGGSDRKPIVERENEINPRHGSTIPLSGRLWSVGRDR